MLRGIWALRLSVTLTYIFSTALTAQVLAQTPVATGSAAAPTNRPVTAADLMTPAERAAAEANPESFGFDRNASPSSGTSTTPATPSRPTAPVLSRAPRAPGSERGRGPTIGTGADRLLGPGFYEIGGGYTEQGLANGNSSFRLMFHQIRRGMALRLEMIMGAPFLRVAGTLEVLPVSLVFTPISSDTVGAWFFNLKISPILRGQFTLNDTDLNIGSSSLEVSPEVVAHFVRMTGGDLEATPNEPAVSVRARPGQVSLVSLRFGAGFGGGIAHGAGGLGSQAGPRFSFEGRLMIALNSFAHAEMAINAHASPYNTIPSLVDVQRVVDQNFGFGGHLGVNAGIANTGINAYIRGIFQAEQTARVVPAAELRGSDFFQLHEPNLFIGGAVGATY